MSNGLPGGGGGSGDSPGDEEGGQEGESKSERIDRELIELLNELRVALPGVQVLFAFLLTVPFAQGFTYTSQFQRDLFFAVLSTTTVSTALLIAPSAWHRIRFRQKDKEHLLKTSNGLAIAGLGFLALSMIGAVALIGDVVFRDTWLTVTSTAVATLVFGGLWAILPLMRRTRAGG
jgi:predicted neutral ceramidase superfamily lipid hydrolase